MNKYRNMKKTILTLIAAIALSMGLYEANAQNVQIHYDMGRGCTTSTVEMFKADDGGLSTSAGSFNNSWLGGLTYSGHSQD